MASNSSTPRAVREAPKIERIFIVTTTGPNRAQRRKAKKK